MLLSGVQSFTNKYSTPSNAYLKRLWTLLYIAFHIVYGN